jgi:8-oxo-dGTP pyrophosphatase MutT (NUDIX family)
LSLFEQLRDGLVCDAAPWAGGGLQAAVLVALTDEGEPQVILARRAKHLRLHPGEIAFPGGKREVEDVSPWDTAKREAWEEIGLEPAMVHSLGELSPLVTRSNFEVYPCIAKIPAVFDMVVDPGELESVFMTPLATFADKGNYRLELMSVEGGSRMVPHYQINQDNVWGVTAAVLVQLVNLVLNANLDLGVTGR